MQYQLLEEELLTKLLKAGDETAFKEIYNRYWKCLFNAVYYRLGSKEIAKELVQNLFLHIWEKRNSLIISNLGHYLQTAIKNRVINHLESTLVQKKYQQHIRETVSYLASETETTLNYNELYLAFERALLQLPEKTGEVFRMSRFDHLSVKEIAIHFNLSEKAVEYHITAALKSLRLSLKDYLVNTTIAIIISQL